MTDSRIAYVIILVGAGEKKNVFHTTIVVNNNPKSDDDVRASYFEKGILSDPQSRFLKKLLTYWTAHFFCSFPVLTPFSRTRRIAVAET